MICRAYRWHIACSNLRTFNEIANAGCRQTRQAIETMRRQYLDRSRRLVLHFPVAILLLTTPCPLDRLSVISTVTSGQRRGNRENSASSNTHNTQVDTNTNALLDSKATLSSVKKSSSDDSNAALSDIFLQFHGIISMQKKFHDAMDITKTESYRDASVPLTQPTNSAPR